jgi:hypothetical protein
VSVRGRGYGERCAGCGVHRPALRREVGGFPGSIARRVAGVVDFGGWVAGVGEATATTAVAARAPVSVLVRVGGVGAIVQLICCGGTGVAATAAAAHTVTTAIVVVIAGGGGSGT